MHNAETIFDPVQTPGRAGGCWIARWCQAQSASKRILTLPIASAAVVVFAIASNAVNAEDKKVTYDEQLGPIFRQRCGSCHNPTAKKGDLDVTNYSALMHGGSSGAVIETGDADSSQLFALVTRQSEPFMPQNADKLPDSEIDLIRRWINGGALENAGSKVAKKAKVKIAAAGDSSKRPDVVPMP